MAALLVGLVATGTLLVVAMLTSLCGLFGEQCSESENTTIGLAVLGAGVTFMGVPVLVAVARRNAAWLLAPVVEVAGAFAILLIFEWY
ncbi:MAG TPA: hypothetical protein VK507_20945 [Iamia sp.]|nr:hypothetical protein [Iamia sp.]